jgi:hypothetical protein
MPFLLLPLDPLLIDVKTDRICTFIEAVYNACSNQEFEYRMEIAKQLTMLNTIDALPCRSAYYHNR